MKLRVFVSSPYSHPHPAARAGHVKIRYDKSRGGLMILEAVR